VLLPSENRDASQHTMHAMLGLTNFFYHGNHVLGDYSSAWGLEKSYILGPWTDEIICFVDRTADSDPPPRYYFTKDWLSSTRELINASATVMTTYDYDVWGSPTETHLSGSVSTHYQFTGRPYREASSLHYYRARYLAHNAGRFISRDPLWHLTRRLVQLYPYVGNNPATFVDPSGLRKLFDCDEALDCELCCQQDGKTCRKNVEEARSLGLLTGAVLFGMGTLASASTGKMGKASGFAVAVAGAIGAYVADCKARDKKEQCNKREEECKKKCRERKEQGGSAGSEEMSVTFTVGWV